MAQELIPPEVANDVEALQIVMQADDAAETSVLVTVDNPAELDYAGQYLREVVTARDKLKAAYARVLVPLKEALAGLDSFFGEPIRRLNEAEELLKQRILDYNKANKTNASIAFETATRETMDRVKKLKQMAIDEETMSLTAETSDAMSEHASKAEEYRSAARELESNTIAPSTQLPSTQGVQVVSRWKGEVTDKDKLWEAAFADRTLRSLFIVPPAKANEFARLTHGARTVPGLRVWDAGTVRAKRKK